MAHNNAKMSSRCTFGCHVCALRWHLQMWHSTTLTVLMISTVVSTPSRTKRWRPCSVS